MIYIFLKYTFVYLFVTLKHHLYFFENNIFINPYIHSFIHSGVHSSWLIMMGSIKESKKRRREVAEGGGRERREVEEGRGQEEEKRRGGRRGEEKI